MTVRIYVPTTGAGLSALLETRRVAGPLTAHAVTAALRSAWPEADDEEAEYAALMAAAAASRETGAGAGERRRVVIAADVPEGTVEAVPDDEDPTRVTVAGDVVWRQVAAALVDPVDDAEDDDDLAWFATQEIAGLV
ncbi:MAG: hypothetical protein U0R80_09020 [Nocardioidaceae bacterium]